MILTVIAASIWKIGIHAVGLVPSVQQCRQGKPYSGGQAAFAVFGRGEQDSHTGLRVEDND